MIANAPFASRSTEGPNTDLRTAIRGTPRRSRTTGEPLVVRIVVLTKPVPDPAAAAERLGPDGRLDRAAAPAVVNGNDEYALEAALQLAEKHGGEVTIVAEAPAKAGEARGKGLAMGGTGRG